MIARALNALGLMRVSEHEQIKNEEILRYTRLNDSLRNERNEAQDKLKRAITDLAAQAEEIRIANDVLDRMNQEVFHLNAEIASLRPDALLWRTARVKRRAGK